MVETKRYETEAKEVKEIVNLQLLKGADKVFGNKREIRKTELVKEPFLKFATITAKIKSDDDKVIVLYIDKPLKEYYAEIYLRDEGIRFFIKDALNPQKELKKKLLAYLPEEEIDKATELIPELVNEIKELIGDKEVYERPIAGAIVNREKIYPFATFNSEQTIISLINHQKVEEINQKIESLQLMMDENETGDQLEPYKEELEKLYKERNKMYQPYLPLAVKTSENGEYIQPNSLFRFGENLLYANEGGNIVLLIPLMGIAQGVVYRRLAFIPRNKYDTSILRKRLFIYSQTLGLLIEGKVKEAIRNTEKNKQIERRLKQIIDFYQTTTEEGKEKVRLHKEEINKAIRYLDSILFPKQILNPFMFENRPEDAEGFKAFAESVREAERKIEEKVDEYTPELLRIAQAFLRLEGKTIKVRRDTGIQEEVFKPENFATKSIYTTIFVKRVGEKLGVDIDKIANELKEIKIITPDGKKVEINGNAYSFINQKIGELYVELIKAKGKQEIEENEEIQKLKAYIEEYIETGRKPFERKHIEVDYDIPDELLFSDEETETQPQEVITETPKPTNEDEDIERILFGEETGEENGDDLEGLSF